MGARHDSQSKPRQGARADLTTGPSYREDLLCLWWWLVLRGATPRKRGGFTTKHAMISPAVKYFLDPRSIEKLNFVYLKDEESVKVLYKCIDPEVLPVEFGGRKNVVYNHEDYSKLMLEDDIKTSSFWADEAKPVNHVARGTLVADITPQSSLIAAKAS